jgi:hypothetical protein
MFEECKGIFFGQNKVVLGEAREVYSLKRLPRGLGKNIQHLVVPFDRPTSSLQLEDGLGGVNNSLSPTKCLEYLDFLRDWSQQTGHLKSLTLIASYDTLFKTAAELRPKEELGNGQHTIPMMDNREFVLQEAGYKRYLVALRKGAQSFSNLERRIVVSSTTYGSLEGTWAVERKYHEFLKELGEAFDADVRWDDLLCFRNGIEIQNAFSTCWDADDSDSEMDDDSEMHYA